MNRRAAATVVCRDGREQPFSWTTAVATGGRVRAETFFTRVVGSTDSPAAAPPRTSGRQVRPRQARTVAARTRSASSGTSAAVDTPASTR
ncbi:hypothetical protein AV521_32460 [Streptomyces sp. IMTB 2501]|nr:hypothetical protein AV521_32460 [Streptomyces sp. IMTB 2501]